MDDVDDEELARTLLVETLVQIDTVLLPVGSAVLEKLVIVKTMLEL